MSKMELLRISDAIQNAVHLIFYGIFLKTQTRKVSIFQVRWRTKILWLNILVQDLFDKKTNKETDRQNKRRGMYQSHTQPGAYLCMFVRPNGVHILFYNDRRMIPKYSGTFGCIQMNPWNIHLCLLFKKNDKWEYFICNAFLTPPPRGGGGYLD